MAFLRTAFFPGGTAAHEAALAEALAGAPVPAARLLFASGAAEGGWQVVQVWETRVALEEFNRDWFLPALRAVGAAGFPAPPQVRDVEDARVWLGGDAPPGER
ncbi:hypothetical protein [Phycicoccus sonneratiae]|uniref:ABM domain-containing protein n=1 Tax=Phycicoccus sonneratiae TaxID=2807628 RepID=A0ABS2CRF7_9MICO|nr:hypothetical protein [Phycicoccus sonneraticus]MBM6402467.1 hypothetical protein [Phycicoccus sonneraticus]